MDSSQPLHLLLLGASVRAATWSARQAGFRVTAVDLFQDQDLCGLADASHQLPLSDYPQGLLPLVRQLFQASRDYGRTIRPIDAIVWTGGLENHPALLDQLAEICPVWSTLGPGLRQVRDPVALSAALQARGIRTPQLGKGIGPVDSTARWLRKPRRSAGGRQIELLPAGLDNIPLGPHDYLQEFLSGPSVAALYVADGRECQLFGITRQWVCHELSAHAAMSSYPFAYVASVGYRPNETEYAQLQTIGETIVAAFGLRGVFGVDMVQSGDHAEQPDFAPVEVNPRYPASAEVIERMRNQSLLARHVSVFTDRIRYDTPAIPDCCGHNDPQPFEIWGKRILFAPFAIHLNDTHMSHLVSICQQTSPQSLLVDIPQCPAEIGAGEPICTLLTVGPDQATVERHLGLIQSSPLLLSFESVLCQARIR